APRVCPAHPLSDRASPGGAGRPETDAMNEGPYRRPRCRTLLWGSIALLAGPTAAAQQRPHAHHLAATPATVAWGYYSAAAQPVLRIASGDTVEVETLITSRPDRLEQAGVPPGEIQQSLRDIVTQ